MSIFISVAGCLAMAAILAFGAWHAFRMGEVRYSPRYVTGRDQKPMLYWLGIGAQVAVAFALIWAAWMATT